MQCRFISSLFFIIFRGERKKQNLTVLFKEKEYNCAISHQIKEGICFNINQLICTTLHRLIIYSMFV